MRRILPFLIFFLEKSSLIYFALSCLLAIKGDLDGHTTEVLLISCFFWGCSNTNKSQENNLTNATQIGSVSI